MANQHKYLKEPIVVNFTIKWSVVIDHISDYRNPSVENFIKEHQELITDYINDLYSESLSLDWSYNDRVYWKFIIDNIDLSPILQD